MSTYTQILYQIVFGSKNYSFFLRKANEDKLYNYIAGILWNKNCRPYKVGGFRNHIHIVCDLHPSISLSSLVKDVKKASHEMMKLNKPSFSLFPGWQVGYGAFTYSQSSLDTLVNYVVDQEKHHRKIPFKEELMAICRDHGVEYNEKYLLK